MRFLNVRYASTTVIYRVFLLETKCDSFYSTLFLQPKKAYVRRDFCTTAWVCCI